MATSGRGSGVVGYNVQVAVDTEHHLIIAHDETNSGSDRAQLANKGRQAKEVLGVASQTVTRFGRLRVRGGINRSQVPSRFQLADIFSPIRLNGRFCQ
jgi:hypothetical protein